MKRMKLLLVGLLFLTGCGGVTYREGYFYVQSNQHGYSVALDSFDGDHSRTTVIIWNGLTLEEAARDARTLNHHLSDPIKEFK